MIEKRVSRRRFLSACGLAASGIALAACAPRASEPASAPTEPPATAEAPAVPTAVLPTPAPKAGATLRLWDGWGGGPNTKVWDTITASPEFKEALGDNQFERKENSGGAEALTTAIAGGDPPDTATNFNYLDFMARGMCLPLEDYISASSKVKPADFLEENWKEGAYKGVQYGVPAYEGFLRFALMYNSQLVEKAGLDPDEPPLTWSETLEWAKKLSQFDSAGNVTVIGLSPYSTMGWGPWSSDGWMVPTSWGWDWFDEKTGKFDLNNAKMVESLNTLKEFVKLIGVDNIAAFYNVSGHDAWGGAFNAGIEASTIQGYWAPGGTATAAPDISKYVKCSWLPVPDSRQGVKVQGAAGHLFTIFKGAKSPDLAFKLCEVVQGKTACDAYFTEGFLPALKPYLNSVDPSVYPGLDFFFKSMTETTEWHRPLQCEITSYVGDQYAALYDQVNRDQMEAAQAAEELQKRCETEYKNQGFGS